MRRFDQVIRERRGIRENYFNKLISKKMIH